jgi:hypothetical protein
MRFTDADVAFVTGMIPHHAQALIMSELAPTNGASQSVQTLAARIINAQTDEIALMQRWLADPGTRSMARPSTACRACSRERSSRSWPEHSAPSSTAFS